MMSLDIPLIRFLASLPLCVQFSGSICCAARCRCFRRSGPRTYSVVYTHRFRRRFQARLHDLHMFLRSVPQLDLRGVATALSAAVQWPVPLLKYNRFWTGLQRPFQQIGPLWSPCKSADSTKFPGSHVRAPPGRINYLVYSIRNLSCRLGSLCYNSKRKRPARYCLPPPHSLIALVRYSTVEAISSTESLFVTHVDSIYTTIAVGIH
jgi:hypothetical protein